MTTKKKVLYWAGYAILLAVGGALSWFRMLPIVNTTIFLFGLMWIWKGLALIFKIGLYDASKYKRKSQLVFSATGIGMGVAWVSLSFFAQGNQAVPVILVSLPFILVDLLVILRQKNT